MHVQESNMVVHGGQLPRKNHSFSDLPGSRGTWNTILRIPFPHSKTIFIGVGRDIWPHVTGRNTVRWTPCKVTVARTGIQRPSPRS